jgi:uncharacterized membrane protein
MHSKWMKSASEHRIEHALFLFSVWIKGIAGVAETISGFLVLFVTQDLLISLVVPLTAAELADEPDDWLATYVGRAVQNFSDDTRAFASAYLVIHGLIKVFLVAGLLRHKLWAYPVSLWFMGAFIGYQLYRFTHSHSIWLVVLSVVDVLVAVLIWREYQWRKSHPSRP